MQFLVISCDKVLVTPLPLSCSPLARTHATRCRRKQLEHAACYPMRWGFPSLPLLNILSIQNESPDNYSHPTHRRNDD